MVNKYGLEKNVFYALINIFKDYSTIIEKAVLFGSRARGDYKRVSDIDIALKFRKDNHKIYKIKEEIENQNIIYTVNILDYDKIGNQKLKNHIDKEGKTIFLTNEKGGVLMNLNKIEDKLEDLKKAFSKLKESAKRNYLEDDIVIDATIKRFEFTYELSWKLMKAYLEYNGNLEATSPRKAIKESFKEGILKEGDKWLQMLQDRSRTAHTYNEESALEIFKNITDIYIDLFEKFITNIEKEIS